jgi:hypothetical protein
MPNRYPTFYNRDLLSAVFFGVAGTVGLINLARSTTPWILWPIFFLWLYSTIARNVVRGMRLNKKGYFSGRRLHENWIYEEMQDRNVVALILPIVQTEIGRKEIFIPSDSEWRSTVPEWARERRTEIASRIAEGWKPKDFHLPGDLPTT